MKFAKIVFLIAGIYGVLLITPLYFAEGLINSTYPPAITHPEYYYGFLGLTLSWQVLFLILSRDPARYRPMILPCFLEKATYVIALATLFLQHRVAAGMLITGAVDTLLGILFLVAYIRTAPARVQQDTIVHNSAA